MSDETGGEGDLSDSQRDTVSKVLKYYGAHNAQWLSQLTLMEEPRIKANAADPRGAAPDTITRESMAMHYGRF